MATRYDIGTMILNKIDPGSVDRITDCLSDLAPDFADHIIESFGDNYARPYLSLKERELVAIASLISQGRFDRLKTHINAIQNLGGSINDVIEIIMQLSYYVGFPTAISALLALKEIIKK